MPQNPTVVLHVHGPVAVITLNRPEKRNAVNAAMARELHTVVEEVNGAPEVAVAVLTGAGGCFCAGMDLQAFLDGEGEAIFGMEGRFAGFVAAELAKPVIAAVEGFALAGGFELALACDMIVAAEDAVFGVPEPTVGLFAAAGGALRLPQLLPPKIAMELVLTGRRLPAQEAAGWGLVNELVPSGEVLTAALRLAERVAANAPLAVQAGLQVARAATKKHEESLWRLSDQAWQRVRASEDAQEGPRAFLEKRTPSWRGE